MLFWGCCRSSPMLREKRCLGWDRAERKPSDCSHTIMSGDAIDRSINRLINQSVLSNLIEWQWWSGMKGSGCPEVAFMLHYGAVPCGHGGWHWSWHTHRWHLGTSLIKTRSLFLVPFPSASISLRSHKRAILCNKMSYAFMM